MKTNRVCGICGKELELNRKNFKRNKYDEFHLVCRDCEYTEKFNKHNGPNDTLLCIKCNRYLPKDMFSITNDKTHKNKYRCGRDSRCRSCRTIQSHKTRSGKSGDELIDRIIKERFLGARDRSKRKGIEFTITEEYIRELLVKQNGKCALSGIAMTFVLGGGRVHTNMSIDRKDTSLGYTKENTQLVCMAVNQMKSDLTIGQLLDFCKCILSNNNLK